ncbi:hypothetical protein BJP27_10845 [Pseudomonas oryzihabitans]|nr:hypothetical protein BJP27_10845 [Pseudomonas psychrotolerans]
MLPAQNVMLSDGRYCASPTLFDDFFRLLRHGIRNLIRVARSLPATRLCQLGESHCRMRLDIGPELYEGWIDCLLATLAQHDLAFDEALREEWRDVLEAGIAVMRRRSPVSVGLRCAQPNLPSRLGWAETAPPSKPNTPHTTPQPTAPSPSGRGPG